MQKRYIFLSVVPIVLSLILALLPDKSSSSDPERTAKRLKAAKYTGMSPENLLLKSVNSERFISPDEMAEAMLGQDPSYLLVDLRDAGQYNNFTLPGALNIPVDQILAEENLPIFQTDVYNVVLFSNGTILADQVWSVLQRKGANSVKILDGGINKFYELYLNPPKPKDTDPGEAFENYRFRRAVGKYLGLPNPDEFIPESDNTNVRTKLVRQPHKVTPTKKAAPKVVVPVKHTGEDEGC